MNTIINIALATFGFAFFGLAIGRHAIAHPNMCPAWGLLTIPILTVGFVAGITLAWAISQS